MVGGVVGGVVGATAGAGTVDGVATRFLVHVRVGGLAAALGWVVAGFGVAGFGAVAPPSVPVVGAGSAVVLGRAGRVPVGFVEGGVDAVGVVLAGGVGTAESGGVVGAPGVGPVGAVGCRGPAG